MAGQPDVESLRTERVLFLKAERMKEVDTMTEAQWKIAYERVEVMTQEQLIWLMKQIRKEELKFENAK